MSKNENGFSLLELLVTISLVVAFTTITLSAYEQWNEHTKEQVFAAQLMTAIQLAHHEALLRGVTVALAPHPTWEKAFDVFIDEQQNGILQQASDLIEQFSVSPVQGTMRWQSFPRHKPYISFLPNGATDFENGSFWYTRKKTKKPTWLISVSQSGRSRWIHCK